MKDTDRRRQLPAHIIRLPSKTIQAYDSFAAKDLGGVNSPARDKNHVTRSEKTFFPLDEDPERSRQDPIHLVVAVCVVGEESAGGIHIPVCGKPAFGEFSPHRPFGQGTVGGGPMFNA